MRIMHTSQHVTRSLSFHRLHAAPGAVLRPAYLHRCLAERSLATAPTTVMISPNTSKRLHSCRLMTLVAAALFALRRPRRQRHSGGRHHVRRLSGRCKPAAHIAHVRLRRLARQHAHRPVWVPRQALISIDSAVVSPHQSAWRAAHFRIPVTSSRDALQTASPS